MDRVFSLGSSPDCHILSLYLSSPSLIIAFALVLDDSVNVKARSNGDNNYFVLEMLRGCCGRLTEHGHNMSQQML